MEAVCCGNIASYSLHIWHNDTKHTREQQARKIGPLN